MERKSVDEPTIRALQGRAFLRGLDGKVLDPRITDVLYDNPFALAEMAAGRLTIDKVNVGRCIWDLIVYNELADICSARE